MAHFHPLLYKIWLDSTDPTAPYTVDDVRTIPAHKRATISFVHEYVHFLQSVGSVPGYRTVAIVVELGIHASLRLTGRAGTGDTVNGYQDILEPLKTVDTGAAQNDPYFKATLDDLERDLTFHFNPYHDYAYTGTRGSWEIDQQRVPEDVFDDAVWGLVTPRGTFRPFTVAMISENMARRIDRWMATNTKCADVPTSNPPLEEEHYNGIRNVLSRYPDQVHPIVLDRLTVAVCHMALATPRPDVAIADMIVRLQEPRTAGGTAQAMAEVLRDQLVAHRQLHADTYNKETERLLYGDAAIMSRQEFYGIVNHMQTVAKAANRVIRDPMSFAIPNLSWAVVRRWMEEFTVPPILFHDEEVDNIDGIAATCTIAEFMAEAVRVLFGNI